MTQGYFVTGTDTGVGKTRISLALMRALQARGHTVLGMKPVASGCRSTADGLRNDDAVQLQAQASFDVPYDQVNPYAFEPPIAPHLAALAVGSVIRIDVIRMMLDRLGVTADRVVVEGVGGWLVPVDASATMADVAVAVDLPVVLVVAVRLGCLNHALLTAAAIAASGVRFAGWVANRLDPACELADENIATLRERLSAPCLGEIDYATDARLTVEQFRRLQLSVIESRV